ncbi:MAG: DUF6055 domain-containing protein [Dysgonamonadaceae bacterium]|nr:DUF6055 domain-containing protein [Dysgonamonadaceae bacterium]
MKNKLTINSLSRFLVLITFPMVLCLASCGKDEPEEPAYQILINDDQKSLSYEFGGGVRTVQFTSSSAWTAEEDADWLSLDKTKGTSGKAALLVTAEANKSDVARQATVIIACGTVRVEISVEQSANTVHELTEADIPNFDKYYKPAEFRNINMLKSDAKWSFYRYKQSEHFFVFWEAGFGENPNDASVSAALRVDIDDLLQKAEKFYKTNIETLKFANVGAGQSYLDKYKMQIYILYQTDWLATGSGYDNKIGALWVNPSTCQPVGSTIAHEIGHSFQYQVYCDKLLNGAPDDSKKGFRYGFGGNGGNGFWEQCAQWQSFQDYPAEIFGYNFDVFKANYHRHFCHEWQRYASYWLQYFWVQKHGIETVAAIWKESVSPEDPIMTYMRLYCGNQIAVLNNEIYDYAARMATFDIDRVRESGASQTDKFSTKLYKLDDGYYQVGYASCPGSTGFNIIPLNVPQSASKVSVQFKGLAPASSLAPEDPGDYKESDAVKGKIDKYNAGVASTMGWRYGFVAQKTSGERVYGSVNQNADGNVEFEVPSDTKRLFLVVTGAPTKYSAHPWDEKELNDEQFPYKVKFENTDLFGAVVINPDDEPTDVAFTYNLSFAADASNYSGATVNISTNGDLAKLCKAFVMQSSSIQGLLLARASQPTEGKIVFAAIQSDGSVSYNFTANGYGFWYDSKGDVISWGSANDSKIFVEFNESTFEFSIGQYPAKCKTGDKYTVKEVLIYTKDGKQYKATFVFNVTIQ